MTTSHAILRDLVSGQTTADSAAGRLKIETIQAQKILAQHVLSGNATSEQYSILTVYKITDKGRESITPKTPS